ncbi:COG4223 family protein [Tropicimonas sp. S265A]|uniref:COG4223 family protein n=1 Tax=Tropicimonas sp. S265A TaxID=3415134 RepID=UPI003C7E7CE7
MRMPPVSDPKSKPETETPDGLETDANAPETTQNTSAKAGDRDPTDVEPETPLGPDDTETDLSSSETDDMVADRDGKPHEASEEPEIEDAELVNEATEAASDKVDAATENDTIHGPEPELEPDVARNETPPAAVAPQQEKRSGFFAPFLGGVVAAGLGFGLCYYLIDQGVLSAGDVETFEEERAQISALEDQIASVRGLVSDMNTEDPRIGPLGDGLAAVQTTIVEVQAEVGELQSEIEAQTGLLSGMQSELDAIAEMPVESSDASSAAVAALQARLQEQQNANAEMQAQLQEMAAQARAEMDEVRNRAGALQQETQAAVDEATNRAALANITSALESGTPLAPSLASITVPVPDALTAVSETGVSTVLELQRGFPAAARAGLSESLKVTVGDAPTDRFMAFLQAQVGARSLEAREGDDPDAVLARAQEAVSSAQFDVVLTELATLPAEGQAAMADWIADAQARVDAVAARDALAAELISN